VGSNPTRGMRICTVVCLIVRISSEWEQAREPKPSRQIERKTSAFLYRRYALCLDDTKWLICAIESSYRKLSDLRISNILILTV
jgi:hypothetical protein